MRHGLGNWVLAGLLLASHGGASAQVYTWTDAQGRKHFSDEASIPGNSREKRVEVPPPNLANRFVPTPLSAATTLPPEDTPTKPDATPAAATTPDTNNKNAKKKAFTREECGALKQAYDASAACFAACSKPVQAYGQRGRNNANCGHCQQLTMPRC